MCLKGGRATERHFSDQPFNQPTNRNQLKTTTASEKVLQRDDSIPCLSKKFSIMPSDQIKNSAR